MRINTLIYGTLIVLLFFISSCAAAPGGTSGNGGSSSSAASLAPGVYVSTTGNDSAIGTNASDPMRTIQLAISNAVTNGFTNIYVAEGTYSNGAGLISTNLTGISNSGIWITNAGIRLSGGWNSTFTSQTGKSLLNGNLQVKHVITVGYISYAVNNVIIEGFCVIGGTADIFPPVGGGIYARSANYLTITNTTISNNRADSWGGGVTLDSCSYTTLSAEITSNYCGSMGGGVFLFDCVASLIDANISKNKTLSEGGGIYINGGCSAITQTGQVISNTAVYGGGIYNDGDFIILTNITVGYNLASLGGGIEFETCYGCSVQGSVINNIATNNGGGILINYGTNLSIDAQVLDNRSTNQGGGIWAGNYCSGIQMTGQVMYNYTGQYGGGIFIQSCSNVSVSANISGNTGGSYAGGAILIDNSTNVRVLSSIITNSSGGGIVAFGYNVTAVVLSNCLIGGTNGYPNYAIVEAYSEVTNHYLYDNTFITNTISGLYSDYNYFIGNTQIAYLNTNNMNGTNFTGAAGAGGNKVTNR